MLPKKLHLHLSLWFLMTLSFILISIFLIIRASGYIINLKAKTLEKTGLIVVSSDPKGALFYLNGKFKAKTSVKLTSLRQGFYDLKIEKTGYQVWEKTVLLEAGKFVDEEAVLFLEKPQIEEAAASELEELKKATNQKKEVVLDEEILKEIPKGALDFTWDKNKKTLLYRTETEIWLYYPNKPEKERNKIVARFSKNIKKIAFYPDFKHILFVIEGELKVVEISGQNEIKLLDLPSLDFWISSSGKEIFYQTENKIFKARVR